MNAASVNTAGFIPRHKTDKMCGPAYSVYSEIRAPNTMCSVFVEPEFIITDIDFTVFLFY